MFKQENLLPGKFQKTFHILSCSTIWCEWFLDIYDDQWNHVSLLKLNIWHFIKTEMAPPARNAQHLFSEQRLLGEGVD